MLTVTLIILVGVISAAWLLLKNIYSYWQRRGFPYIEPSIPIGNLQAVKSGKRSFGLALYDLYCESKEKFVGIYLLFRPALLVRDAQLARDILTKDFSSFHDRGIFVDESDPIGSNLFALKGQSWKTLRAKLTPTFSSGKLKNMYPTIKETGVKLQDYLDTVVPEKEGTVVEMKDLLLKYAVDIIGSVIFGLEVNSFKHPENDFRAIGFKINERSIIAGIRLVGVFLCPKLFSIIPLRIYDRLFDNKVATFMTNLVKETIQYREKNNVSRKDMMQLLIQLRNTGKVNLDDSVWDVETTAENLKSMSIEQIAGQAFLFYIAGNETSASTSAFLLYELAQNPDILRKVEKDIESALERHDGQLTYDSLQDMKYLDLCIMETVRKYPGLPMLNRECSNEFRIPGTDYTIEKGTSIIISLMGIHRDEKYFPDPLKFDPERFVEGSQNYNPIAYMPFGEGPRQCIGIRLGKLNVKVAIAAILMKFNLEALERKEIEFDNYSVTIMPKGGINVRVTRKQTRREII